MGKSGLNDLEGAWVDSRRGVQIHIRSSLNDFVIGHLVSSHTNQYLVWYLNSQYILDEKQTANRWVMLVVSNKTSRERSDWSAAGRWVCDIDLIGSTDITMP